MVYVSGNLNLDRLVGDFRVQIWNLGCYVMLEVVALFLHLVRIG